VLDGGSAVPCNPKPAYAGSKERHEAGPGRTRSAGPKALKAGSCDGRCREPRQNRKVATVNGLVSSRKSAWLELKAGATLSPTGRRRPHGRTFEIAE